MQLMYLKTSQANTTRSHGRFVNIQKTPALQCSLSPGWDHCGLVIGLKPQVTVTADSFYIEEYNIDSQLMIASKILGIFLSKLWWIGLRKIYTKYCYLVHNKLEM